MEERWLPVLNKINLKQRGQIGYEEFLAAAIDHEQLITEDNMKIIFNLFDTDKDGKLSAKDLHNYFCSDLHSNDDELVTSKSD